MWLELSCSIYMSLISIGQMPILLHAIWLTACHNLCWITRSLSPCYIQMSLFSLPPRVFGCIAFIHNLEPNRDKLAPRSLNGVFLGYPLTQKLIIVTVLSRTSIISGSLHSFLQETILFCSHQIWYLPYHFRSFLNLFQSPLLLYRFIRDPRTDMLYCVIQPPQHIIFRAWYSGS